MLQMIDIVRIAVFDDGHTGFYTTAGRWACSCGIQDMAPDPLYFHEYTLWLDSETKK